MKKIIYLIWIALLILTASVSAEYIVYNNTLDFEKAKWDICEQATDGCNTYSVIDWKVTHWTKMYCENHTPEWTCTKVKDEVMTTMSLPTTTSNEDDERMCTMDYNPVCAKVQIQCITTPCNPILETFSNACMAWDNEIVYAWECNTKLSEKEVTLYNTIKSSKLDDKYQEKVYKVLDKYKKIISKHNERKQNLYNQLMLEKIDEYLNQILLDYPQDTGLPKTVAIKYLMFKLLRFEIQML